MIPSPSTSFTARRIAVVGNSGSGKSTLARRLAARIGGPHIELDAIHHGPGWTPIEREHFVAELAQRCAEERWVVDGNYSAVRPTVWSRAEAVIWLDLPRSLVMRQVVTRTLRRLLLQTPLWNGNRERVSNLVSWDPQQSIIRWSWTQHASYVARYTALMTDPAHAALHFHRLRSHVEVERFMQTIPLHDG